jgi:hypothetical protein
MLMYLYFDPILFDLLIVVMYSMVDASFGIYLFHLYLMLLLDFLKIILFLSLEMFPMKRMMIAVAVVAAAVVAVLYDDFRRFQEQQHRLNLNYRMYVLAHPTKANFRFVTQLCMNLHRQSIILLQYNRVPFV